MKLFLIDVACNVSTKKLLIFQQNTQNFELYTQNLLSTFPPDKTAL